MTVNEEWFDIYDRQMKHIGSAPRSEVHAQGHWHQTFQCWVLRGDSDNRTVLLQERHLGKDTFPGYLDISCAGHLAAGESVADGIRELHEELGLEAAFHQLIFCGVYVEEDILEDQKIIDREFCHVFIYECDQPLIFYKLQHDEVTGLYEVPIHDFQQLISGETSSVSVKGVRTGSDPSDPLVESTRIIERKHLVPHDADFFDLLFTSI